MRYILPLAAVALAGSAVIAYHGVTRNRPGGDAGDHQADKLLDTLPPDLLPIVQRLRASDPMERAQGALQLKALGENGHAATPYLAVLLKDRTKIRMRLSAIYGSEGTDDDAGCFTCPGALAAAALAGCGERGVLALVAALDGREGSARRSAVEGAGGAQDERLIARLVHALGDDDRIIREGADASLRRTGAPAVPVLIQALRSRNRLIRSGAAAVLAEANEAASLAQLLAGLAHGDERTRIAAATAVKQISGPQCVPPLIQLLADDSLRATAAGVLAQINDPCRSELLIDALQHPSFRIRAGAAYALSIVRDASAIEPLRRAVLDPQPEVSKAAAEALATLTSLPTSEGR